MAFRLRFAPSPSGALHVGNARTALLTALFACRARAAKGGVSAQGGGVVVLRHDDGAWVGLPETEARIAAVRDDMAWLGLTFAEEVRQSQQSGSHARALAALIGSGRAYPCYETAEELAAMRERVRKAGRPFLYRKRMPGRAEARAAIVPHWRFALEAEPLIFEDMVRGATRVKAAALSDPVIARSSAEALYLLASVADDTAMGITHIIRGEDHVANTAIQIAMWRALGASVPVFGHHPLVVDASGRPLSKRAQGDGTQADATLAGLRARGVEPEPLRGLLVALGSGRDPDPRGDWAGMAQGLDLAGLSRAPARFDGKALARVRRLFVRGLGLEEARHHGELACSDTAWGLAREEAASLDEARGWLAPAVLAPYAGEALVLARAALATMPEGEASEAWWERWREAFVAQTGLTTGKATRVLRQALTGQDAGAPVVLLVRLMEAEGVKTALYSRLGRGAGDAEAL